MWVLGSPGLVTLRLKLVRFFHSFSLITIFLATKEKGNEGIRSHNPWHLLQTYWQKSPLQQDALQSFITSHLLRLYAQNALREGRYYQGWFQWNLIFCPVLTKFCYLKDYSYTLLAKRGIKLNIFDDFWLGIGHNPVNI